MGLAITTVSNYLTVKSVASRRLPLSRHARLNLHCPNSQGLNKAVLTQHDLSLHPSFDVGGRS